MRQWRIITVFTEHHVASNLLMLLMIFMGLWSLYHINTQTWPTFTENFFSVTVVWPGASAEDVERSITQPIEKELRRIDSLKEMTSTSREGSSSIILEMRKNADMSNALEQIKTGVSLVRNLPPASEPPIVEKIIEYDFIARMMITSPGSLQEIRPLIHEMERQLLDKGIDFILVTGLPDEEIAIKIPTNKLIEHQLSLPQFSELIQKRSVDIPGGLIGRAENTKQLRAVEQKRSEWEYDQLSIFTDDTGKIQRLGDIATIEKRPRLGSVEVFHKGQPAVQMSIYRGKNTSALGSAKIFHNWLEETKPKLSKGINIYVYDEAWTAIKERINLMLENGIIGVALILIILFIALNHKVAFWVAVGIPVSILAAIGILYLLGGSINMVSMFAIIMTLGIIVDDTVVVGEETLSQLQNGKKPLEAIQIAVHKMLPPVLASSLTTIAAFIPLLFIGGIIGKVLADIPLVVICVIIASLAECFLVLPGHLRHSFHGKVNDYQHHPLRKKIDGTFEKFRDGKFRNLVRLSIQYHWLTLSLALALFIFSLGLVALGIVPFTFFPSPDARVIDANVQFVAGTPPNKVKEFLNQLEKSLYKTGLEMRHDKNKPVITASEANLNVATRPISGEGEQYAHLFVELVSTDEREFKDSDFIEKWRQNIKMVPGIENLTILAQREGPPGFDIDIQLTGYDSKLTKQAALDIAAELRRFPGVTDIVDNMPFGQEELIYELTPEAKALGLTIENVGRQMRAAFSGQISQIYYQPNDEIEVRVVLPDNERNYLASLNKLPIITPQGKALPLTNVVNLRADKSLNVLRHTNTKLSARVSAEVNEAVANSNEILDELETNFFPTLKQKYPVDITLKGRAEEQKETLGDMLSGLFLASVLIYIILAWAFNSYGLPLLVMSVIPFGITGAIFGHLFMGVDLTILSLFGFFGLSGIVINDSIILVTRYFELKKSDISTEDAIVAAACQRLRAVILTSITTIAGLLPLLLETSLQALYLIPMAISISFGLAYATLLVLFVMPSILSIYEAHKIHLKPLFD